MDKLLLLGMSIIMMLSMAISGGTIVWVIWPTVMTIFPTLVTKGYVVADITWSSAVCLSWLCGLLIKSSSLSSDSD